jgi:hypothetical protein
MSASSLNLHKAIVVAVDFGTRFTGYSYARAIQPDEILRSKPKVKTDVVLDSKDNNVVSFGDEAQRYYLSARTSDPSTGLRFFSQFKMSLYQVEGEPDILVRREDSRTITTANT